MTIEKITPNVKRKLRFKLEPGAIAPRKAHPDDAGWDLAVYIRKPLKGAKDPDATLIGRNEVLCIGTGVHVAIPQGYVGLVLPRSSTLLEKELIVFPGVIDAGYTGEIKLTIQHIGDGCRFVDQGERLAQLVVVPIPSVELEEVSELPETERGSNGFGSSGI